MRGKVLLVAAISVVAAACGNTPTGPTDGGPSPPRLSRTRFMAFGDSFTAGEVTNPATAAPGTITRLIVVPSASYPSVLQSRLQSTYTSQSSSISVTNAGEPGERILDGAQRFPGVYDASRPEVVLLQEGA
jgi:hypothetical protein